MNVNDLKFKIEKEFRLMKIPFKFMERAWCYRINTHPNSIMVLCLRLIFSVPSQLSDIIQRLLRKNQKIESDQKKKVRSSLELNYNGTKKVV